MLGFPPPHQTTSDLQYPPPYHYPDEHDLKVEPGDAYLAQIKEDSSGNGSRHKSTGDMFLTSNPGFLSAETPLWHLMKYSAVHELYHAIQDTMGTLGIDDSPIDRRMSCE